MDGFLPLIPSEKRDGHTDGDTLRHTSFPIPLPREKPLFDLEKSLVDALALALGEQFRPHRNGLMLLDGFLKPSQRIKWGKLLRPELTPHFGVSDIEVVVFVDGTLPTERSEGAHV